MAEFPLEKGIGDIKVLQTLGLTEDPFSLSASPRFFHLGESHQSVYYFAHNSITRRDGLALVMGEVGMGKSSLARVLFSHFFEERPDVIISYVPSANWKSRTKAVREISDSLAELEVETKRSYDDSIFELQKAIMRAHRENNLNVAVLLDESHLISPGALEAIHELYNFDVDVKAVQIIMFGQPELDALISKHAHLKSRVSKRLYLSPLSYIAALEMINHRVRQAGRSTSLLTDEAYSKIFDASQGVPRDIVGLCGNALEIIIRDKKKIIDEEAADEALLIRYGQQS